MRSWYKHGKGFINIDDENVYITKTGNWSEIDGLQEKNTEGFHAKDRRSKSKVIAYFTTFIAIISAVLFAKTVSMGIIVTLSILFFFAYKYLIPEYGASYKIPRSKIQNILDEGEKLSILFLDANDADSLEIFKGVSEEGRKALTASLPD